MYQELRASMILERKERRRIEDEAVNAMLKKAKERDERKKNRDEEKNKQIENNKLLKLQIKFKLNEQFKRENKSKSKQIMRGALRQDRIKLQEVEIKKHEKDIEDLEKKIKVMENEFKLEESLLEKDYMNNKVVEAEENLLLKQKLKVKEEELEKESEREKQKLKEKPSENIEKLMETEQTFKGWFQFVESLKKANPKLMEKVIFNKNLIKRKELHKFLNNNEYFGDQIEKKMLERVNFIKTKNDNYNLKEKKKNEIEYNKIHKYFDLTDISRFVDKNDFQNSNYLISNINCELGPYFFELFEYDPLFISRMKIEMNAKNKIASTRTKKN